MNWNFFANSPTELAVLIDRNLSDAAKTYLAWRILPVEMVQEWAFFAIGYGGKTIDCRPELHGPLSSMPPDQIIVFPDGSLTHETNWSFDVYQSGNAFRKAWDWSTVVDDGSAISRFGMMMGWVPSPPEEGEFSPHPHDSIAGENDDG